MGLFNFRDRVLELKLSIPEQPCIMDPRIETRVKELGLWVENLPYANTQQTINLLYESLVGLNHYPVSSLIRFALLEHYHQAYQNLPHELLGASRAGLVSAAKHHQYKITSKIYPLTSALALGYKMVVNDSASQKFRWGHKKFVQAVQRVMTYMILETLECYDAYALCPEQSWYDIHQLFLWVAKHDIESMPVEEGITIAQIYKTIGLVSLADPYRLPVSGSRVLYQLFTKQADRVQFLEHDEVTKEGQYVTIDMVSDSGRWLPYQPEQHQDESRYQIIQVNELVQFVRQQLKVLQSGGQILDSKTSFPPRQTQLLLNCWLQAIAAAPNRRRCQRPPKSAPLIAVCGLEPVYYYLNQQQAFDPLQGKVTAESESVIEIGSAMGQTLKQVNKSYNLYKGQMTDSDAGGVGFLLAYPAPDELSVGQLIAIKVVTPAQSVWQIGLVRWLYRQGQAFKGGMQLLPVGFQPIAAKINAKDRVYRQALLAPYGSQRCLLVPAELYGPPAPLLIHLQGQDYPVTVGQSIMSSDYCECFVIKG